MIFALCRTAALGGHLDQCDQCGHCAISYKLVSKSELSKVSGHGSSPMAGRARSRVVAGRVFPRGLHAAAADRQPGAAECPENLRHSLPGGGRDPINDCRRHPNIWGAAIGFLAVLHTWGQNHPSASTHPLRRAWRRNQPRQLTGWIPCRKYRKSYFLPVQVLSSFFRKRFLIHLRRAFQKGKLHFHGELAPVGPTGGLRGPVSEGR